MRSLRSRPRSASDVGEAHRGAAGRFERSKRALAAAAAFVTGFPSAALRFFIGRDVFFSYARADGDAYVQALANAVVGRRPGISFYLDQYAAPPTPELPSSLVRHLHWSRMLVLVCTEAAVNSVNVQSELTLFMSSPRPLVPISINDGARNIDATAEPWRRISGGRWVTDEIDEESPPCPSDAVVARVVESIKFTDHQTRIKRILIASGIAAAAALFAAVVAWNKIEQANAAETARASAAAEAVRETQKASALALSNQAELLRIQPDQLETSALLAAAAVDQLTRLRVPSIEAYRTLTEALDTLPLPTFNVEIAANQLPDRVAISPDGRYVAASAGEVFTLREVASGKVLPLRLPGPSGPFRFSPDGKYLVIGIANRVEVWTTGDWQPSADSRLAAWRDFPGAVARLELDVDGRYLICADETGETRVVRASDWTQVWSRHLDGPPFHVAVSEDGRFLATMTWFRAPQSVDVWDLQRASASAKPVRSVRDHEAVHDLSVTDEYLMLVSERAKDMWSRDLRGWGVTRGGGEAPLWTKALKPDAVRESAALLAGTVDQVAFAPHGAYVAYVSNQARYIAILRLPDREELWRTRLSNEVREIVISPNGRRILGVGEDGLDRVWDARSGREVSRMQHDGRIVQSSFSSTGDTLCGADEFRRLRCWTIGGAVERARLDHDHSVRAVAFSDAGMETVSFDYEAGLYSNATRGLPGFWRETWSIDRIQSLSASRQDRNGGVRAITYRADGSQVLVAIDDEARLFRRGEGAPVAKFGLDDDVNVVAMSRDGGTVAIATQGGTVGVWRADGCGRWQNAARFVVIAEYDATKGPPSPHSEVTAMALDDKGEQLAVGGTGGSVLVWRCCAGALTKAPYVRIELGSEARAMAFSPVAPATLAMLLDSGSLHVIDLVSRKPFFTVIFQPPRPERSASVADESRRIAFSPDGRYVATGGYDGYVRVWDLVRKAEVARLRHDAWVDAVAFDRSGDRVASGSYDGTARIWRWRPEALIREVCRRVGTTALQELKGHLNSRSVPLPCQGS